MEVGAGSYGWRPCLGGPPRAPPGRRGRGALGEAAYGEPWQAEVGAGEEAQVDGVAVEADVFQLPPCVLVLLGVTEGVFLHGLYPIILERIHQWLH